MIGAIDWVSTPGSHETMQGKSSHIMHAAESASMIGVPPAIPNRSDALWIAPYGQAAMQSPQRVQPDRNISSSMAPGGRNRGTVRDIALRRRSVGGTGSMLMPLMLRGFTS